MTEGRDRDPDVLTTKELAIKLGLSPQTIRRMANAGQIPALKTGKDFRYSWEAVRDVLRQPHRSEEHSTDDKHNTNNPLPSAAKEPATAHSGMPGPAPSTLPTPDSPAARTGSPAVGGAR
jgi:excisionase family DNA binding protein